MEHRGEINWFVTFLRKQYMCFFETNLLGVLVCELELAYTSIRSKLTRNTILSYFIGILVNIYGTVEEFIQSYCSYWLTKMLYFYSVVFWLVLCCDNHKKRGILFLTITLPNLNWFLWFLHHFNCDEILHARVIKFITSADLCDHLTCKKLKPTFLPLSIKRSSVHLTATLSNLNRF